AIPHVPFKTPRRVKFVLIHSPRSNLLKHISLSTQLQNFFSIPHVILHVSHPRRPPPVNHRITGTTMPVLEFALDHNDAVISEAGELSWMSASIQMTTHTQMAGGGGFFGAIKRVAGGGSLFMTEYRAYGAPGEVAFATRVPGH